MSESGGPVSYLVGHVTLVGLNNFPKEIVNCLGKKS